MHDVVGRRVVYDAPHRVAGGTRRREQEIGEAGVGLSLLATPVEKRARQTRRDTPSERQPVGVLGGQAHKSTEKARGNAHRRRERRVALRDEVCWRRVGDARAPEIPPCRHVRWEPQPRKSVARIKEHQRNQAVERLHLSGAPDAGGCALARASAANCRSYQCTRQWSSTGGSVEWTSVSWSVGRPSTRRASASQRQPSPESTPHGIAQILRGDQDIDIDEAARPDVAVEFAGEKTALEWKGPNPRGC